MDKMPAGTQKDNNSEAEQINDRAMLTVTRAPNLRSPHKL